MNSTNHNKAQSGKTSAKVRLLAAALQFTRIYGFQDVATANNNSSLITPAKDVPSNISTSGLGDTYTVDPLRFYFDVNAHEADLKSGASIVLYAPINNQYWHDGTTLDFIKLPNGSQQQLNYCNGQFDDPDVQDICADPTWVPTFSTKFAKDPTMRPDYFTATVELPETSQDEYDNGLSYYCLCTTITTDLENGRKHANIMTNDPHGTASVFGDFYIRVLPAASASTTESTSADVATPATATNTSVPATTTTNTTTATTPNKPIFFNGPVVNYAGEPFFKAGQTAAFRGFDREGGTLNIRKYYHEGSEHFPLCDQTDPGSAILVSEKFTAVPGSPDGAFELQLTIPTTWTNHEAQICYVDADGNILN